MSFTELEYQQMLARTVKQRVSIAADGPQLESDLHEEIAAYCRSKGWYFVRSRMDKRSTNAIGTPDFIIAADAGKTFWIECKRKGNKPSLEQLATICHLNKLGHKAAIVYSMEEFLKVINDPSSATAKDYQ